MAVVTNSWAIFNGYNLNSIPGLTVIATDPYKPATRALNFARLARAAGGSVNSGFFTDKVLNITCVIAQTSRALLEQSFDTLWKNIPALEASLVLPQGATVRQYYATYESISYVKNAGGYSEFTLSFRLSDPFGYDTGYINIVNKSGITASSQQDNFDFDGSADEQVPIYELQFSAISGGTTKVVTLGNNQTGQVLSISRTWSAGDKLTVDTRLRTVQVNGVDVAWTGALPTFAPGSRTLTYSDTFTSRTFSYKAWYYKRWV